MPSNARCELAIRLADVHEIILAHETLTGGLVGRPAMRQGTAVTRAGVVLLAAAMEAYVEDLFKECARLRYPALTIDEMADLCKSTSGRLNNADVYKTNLLYLNLGVPFVLSSVRWQKCSNAAFQTRINKLIETRNQIAHGTRPVLQLTMLRSWLNMVERYSERLEQVMSAHILRMTGCQSGW